MAAGRQDGVQGRHGVLEDHADAGAAHCAQLLFGGGGQVPAVQPDLPGGDAAGAGQHAGQGECGGGLPRAGLTDDGQGLAPVQGERDAADGTQRRSVGGGELDAEVADLQQLLGGHRRISRLSASAMRERPRTSAVTVIRGPAAKFGACAR